MRSFLLPLSLILWSASAFQIDIDNGLSRREVFQSTAKIAIIASTVSASSSPAFAITSSSAETTTTQSQTIVSNTLCDPAVSTWVKNDRTIHILGTAHISSASAELAGKMVREIKPNVVFVELDAKRVSRAGIGNSTSTSKTNTVASSNEGAADSTPSVTAAAVETETTLAPKSSVISTPSNDAPQRKIQISNPLVNVGSKYVGNAVKGMYTKLESEGFKAGDEFINSVREGLAIGSTIVLGDRDVEVTLKRLTQALTKTDIRKLLSSDSEVEKSMEGLLPDQMKSNMNQPSDSVTMGVDDATFNSFVETMKAKENVKKIMGALKETAPEIYQAMVAERDVYMARGLDELGMNVKSGSSVETTVAVMGMAHVDGVENYLATNGWKDVSYPCPANL
ncbi:TraB domain-containing protein [Skeletonema marinoi]|uniref:TraB domain-containing protein n=1 Tax=Skeletonema marinoi TaxID=267567 RepID=A0AAD8Y410_9STRA|nr:TraB domain-containing protein [Skeletonema marinoi]